MSKPVAVARSAWLVVILFSFAALIALQTMTAERGPAEIGHRVDSRSFKVDPNATFAPPQTPSEINPVVVAADVSEPEATFQRGLQPTTVEYILSEPPRPAGELTTANEELPPPAPAPQQANEPEAQAEESIRGPRSPLLGRTFDTTNFDTNIPNTGGYVFIPPDPIGAAGPNHLVNVVNVTVRFHSKDGTLLLDTSLANFFASLSPANFLFDPKVIYDQYAGRFLIVVLEKVDDEIACATAPACTSRILLAVSDNANPVGTWYFTSINGEENISGFDCWADYPGFAIDEEAVYVTTNMFGFYYEGGNYRGTRLWIVDKSPFYTGGTASVTKYNPYSGGGIATTTQPAHVFGTGLPASVGTFLVSYSGITNGVTEAVQVVRIDNPLGAVSFTQELVILGDIDDTTVSPLVDAQQKGTSTRIEVNDRRALNAVWRNDSLWMTATLSPSLGPNLNQTTAYWWQLDTSTLGTTTVKDMGEIGGEDIAHGTYTFFPAVAVNDREEVAIGFAASQSSIYAGSYYTTRMPGDPASSTRGSRVLRKGTDYYIRTFGGARNRWGDYTGMAVDPQTNCFWVYNQHAITRGTATSPPPEDGRWGTAFGEICTGFRTMITSVDPATDSPRGELPSRLSHAAAKER